LEFFTVNWNILWTFGNVVVIWYIFSRFGILCQDKSGNPALEACKARKSGFSWRDLSVTKVSGPNPAVIT
jgi:hypothetical protein